MHVLTCALLVGALSVGSTDNLNLSHGLDGWQGDGFYLTHGTSAGPGTRVGLCSSDAGNPKRKGKISYRFTVPKGAEALTVRAFAVRPAGLESDHRLDVVMVLPDENNRLVPKQVRADGAWTPTALLLPRWQGQPRSYRWDLVDLRGKTVQLIVRDQDDRPGCYVYAGGLRLVQSQGQADALDDDFIPFMLELAEKHKLLPMARYDSKRFTAVSNAPEKLTREHLRHYELFYDLFLDHFRRRGFTVTAPPRRLMVAVFETPEGFNAYFGQKFAPAVAGMYHTKSNRLVVYDLGQTAHFLAAKDKSLKTNQRFTGSVERWYRDAAFDANLGTAIHECAHQLSFNCGLLNREGRAPVWLVEGLACYCESTNQGDLQSIGAPNPRRLATLTKAGGNYLPLPDLLKADNFLRSPNPLLAYAQSWALFRMLMEQQPTAMRDHLTRIGPRLTSEYYLADFRASFGNDLPALERRYRAYLDNLVQLYPPRAAR